METINELPQKKRGWLRKLGCCAGIFVFVILLLIGILVWVVYRRDNTASSTDVSVVQNFTRANITIPAPSSNAPIATNDDPSVGPANAQVTVVEFSDFECPFCKEAFPILGELRVRYGDRVRFVYRDFPITQVHDNAQKAAEAGECAHAQGRFWSLHDKIFQNAPRITVPELKQYAREVGLDATTFDTCLDSGQFAREVQEDLADGTALGVGGTPTWFFNGRKVEGVIPRETFIAILEQLLRAQ